MHRQQLMVRPKIGLTVPMPDGSTLPPEGATVPRDTYWLRRLRDGSVTQIPTLKDPKEG